MHCLPSYERIPLAKMRYTWYGVFAVAILLANDTEGFLFRDSAIATRKTAIGSKLSSSTSSNEQQLFPTSIYDTIQEGKIAVIPDFLPKSEILSLQRDAQDMYSSHFFSTDALSSYGSTGKFDPTKDRTVLKLSQWKNTALGDWSVRKQFSARIRDLRSDLSQNLQRPGLLLGTSSVPTYGGEGSTEISYTRFGPGAFLKRHVDEHHEELKGTAGWSKPTRRSLSWLIYLNDDWNPDRNGGCLRCYQRTFDHGVSHRVGSRPNGDLQIGWLRPTLQDPLERPVFLDAQCSGTGSSSCSDHSKNHYCAMYIDDPDADITTSTTSHKRYITQKFSAHPTLFVAGGEFLTQKLLVQRKDYANRFYFIEPPKSLITEWLGAGPNHADENSVDIAPLAATLVIFDSVTLPHEVLPSIHRPRWATSGWMHEDQQSVETHPYHINSDDSKTIIQG